MGRLYTTLIICLFLITSCTVARYYELRHPEYPVILSKNKRNTYRNSIDGIDVDVKALDKDYCDVQVLLYIMNNRSDTLYVNMAKAEIWYSGGHFSPFVENHGGRNIREKVTMILPGKRALIIMYAFVCSFSEGKWVRDVYAFPGTIYTSSGFGVTLDTLDFTLQQER